MSVWKSFFFLAQAEYEQN